MAAPLYFLPGLQRQQLVSGGKLIKSILNERGLGSVWSDVTDPGQVGLCNVDHGPGDLSGVIVVALPADTTRHIIIGFKPTQVWEEVGDGLWIGVDPQMPPMPEDVIRSKTFTGYPIGLADDNQWIVPIVRRPHGVCKRAGIQETELPRQVRFGRDGAVQGTLKPQYRTHWDLAGEVADYFFDADGVNTKAIDFAEDWGIRSALSFLGLNYRVSEAEQNAIGFLDSENYVTVLGAAIDMPQAMALVQEWSEQLKKTDDRLAVSGANGKSAGEVAGSMKDPAEATST